MHPDLYRHKYVMCYECNRPLPVTPFFGVTPCAHVRDDGAFCKNGSLPAPLWLTDNSDVRKMIMETDELWALD